MKYDYLIVGSGLYGATFAFLANKAGKNRTYSRDGKKGYKKSAE